MLKNVLWTAIAIGTSAVYYLVAWLARPRARVLARITSALTIASLVSELLALWGTAYGPYYACAPDLATGSVYACVIALAPIDSRLRNATIANVFLFAAAFAAAGFTRLPGSNPVIAILTALAIPLALLTLAVVARTRTSRANTQDASCTTSLPPRATPTGTRRSSRRERETQRCERSGMRRANVDPRTLARPA